jgi:hypothetical protein
VPTEEEEEEEEDEEEEEEIGLMMAIISRIISPY